MTSTTADVDVIIPTYGRGKLIDVTITSIRQSSNPNFTLWIVDQSPDGRTRDAVMAHAALDPRVRYIHIDTPGASLARNTGVTAGEMPYVLFTDDDCRVAPDWIDEMLAELRSDMVCAVFGRVIPDGEYRAEQPARSQRVSHAITIALKDSAQREVYQSNRFNLGFGHGANMGFRRTCYTERGGFDELLGAGGRFPAWEERDLGYRLLAGKGRIIYTPRATVYHRHWRGWSEVKRTYRNYAIGTGAVAGKYLRCGDIGGGYILLEWLIGQGLRQVLSGAVKWRSWQKVMIGLLQLIYPWVGLFRSLRSPIDREQQRYHRGQA
jgi:GT2 family glycosyltransferase